MDGERDAEGRRRRVLDAEEQAAKSVCDSEGKILERSRYTSAQRFTDEETHSSVKINVQSKCNLLDPVIQCKRVLLQRSRNVCLL